MQCNGTVIVFAVIMICFTVFSTAAEAKTVTMNFAFSFNGDKSDTIRVNETSYLGTTTQEKTFTSLGKKFISAERGTSVLGLVFAGSEFINVKLNTSYSATAYMLGMSQDEINNRFLLAFTTGVWGNIDSKTSDVESFGYISKVFGDVTFTQPETFPFFIKLEYRNVDLLNRTIFRGPARFFMTNTGKSGTLTNVTTEVF
ncbi:hypothetical protein HYZ41_00125 [archaeon]|nr:hypothetical protein [archaeon]